jgi:TrmH family RNA methyltransferase
VTTIRSAANDHYRNLLRLGGSARERRRSAQTVIEGIHLIEAYLDRYGDLRTMFVPERALALPEHAALIARQGRAPTVLADPLFERASQVGHGNGPLAVIDVPVLALPELIDSDAVYLDRIQDPGNLGTILRTCAAVGVRTVMLSPEATPAWSPKALRAGMGAHFHLQIHEEVPATMLGERVRVELLGLRADDAQCLYDVDLLAPVVWLLGNEGAGLAGELLALPGARAVSIPQAGAVESLNVATAAAVALYEQFRQRRVAAAGPATGSEVV